MALIYEIQPGYAMQIPADPGPNPLTLDVGGFGAAPAAKSIITQLSIGRAANAQFVHTLQDLIYVYSFGERAGTISVAGLSFVGMCDSQDSQGGRTGIEYVLKWYDDNRLGGSMANPLRILLGGGGDVGVFRAYLLDLKVDLAQADFRLASFGLQFRSLPQRRKQQ